MFVTAATACGGFDEAASTGSVGPTTAVGGDDTSTSGDSVGDATSMTTAASDNATSTSMADASSGGPMADASTDGGDGSSDGVGGTGGAGVHDGVYTGTLEATFNVLDFGDTFNCSGQATITVDSTAPQVVTGSATCTAFIPQLGGAVTVNGSIVGDVASPTASGTLTISDASGFLDNSGPWVGDFVGDVFDGSFNGNVAVGAGVPYSGSWNTQR